VTSDRRLIYCRHMFLTCLRAQYWKSIHEGRVPRNEKVAQCLLYSVDHSIHNTSEALSDWSIVCRELSTPEWWDRIDRYLLSVTPDWFSLHNLGLSENAKNTYDRIYILINYISAHEKCQHEIYEFLDDEEQSLLSKRRSPAAGSSGEDKIWIERSNQKVFHEVEVVIDESKANVSLCLASPLFCSALLCSSLFPSTLCFLSTLILPLFIRSLGSVRTRISPEPRPLACLHSHLDHPGSCLAGDSG
jgi:hypothetical protein